MRGQQTPPQPAHVPGTTKGEELAMKAQQKRGSAGKSTARDFTGINPQDRNPIDPKSPTIPPP